MKKFLLFFILAFLHAQMALADGSPHYVLEGNVKYRFYYDTSFFNNQLSNYSSLGNQLVDSLNWTGTNWLGVKFTNTARITLVDMGSQQLWSRAQLKTWLDANLPLEPGIVKVLIHSRGVTPDGICYDDIPGSGVTGWDAGLTYIGPSGNGAASAQVTVTARNGCSVNAGLRLQGDINETFVHEMGHAVGHPGELAPKAQACDTNPAAIMCEHPFPAGVVRSWQKWGTQDVYTVRTYLFGSARKNPIVSCYQYNSYQSCNNTCLNTAGFPNIGATEVYNNCLANFCNNMCN
ncbi:MAG: hypothetical protein ABUS47_08335 [Steroidobacter sp.]